MEPSRSWGAAADRLAGAAAADGRPTGWFEELWSAAARDDVDMPWDRTSSYPPVAAWVAAAGEGRGRRAVVVGAGLGADAELLASRGFETVAFDLAPTAVELARARHPGTSVDYRVADLLDLAEDLVGGFDVVVDVFTVQALPRALRADAVSAVCSLLAPGGRLLAVGFVQPPGASAEAGPPWPLTRAEMEGLAGKDVRQVSLREEPLLEGGPPAWIGHFTRDDARPPTAPDPSHPTT